MKSEGIIPRCGGIWVSRVLGTLGFIPVITKIVVISLTLTGYRLTSPLFATIAYALRARLILMYGYLHLNTSKIERADD
jgi:hypothetical protein